MRSDLAKKGFQRAPNRALFKAMGFDDWETKRPIIGIANSFNECIPGHIGLNKLADSVKRGIYAGGGMPMEFNTIGICDGIAMGHIGMKYSLPSRELIADSVEYMANAHCADAMVCISNCDKITPGMMMAALRLNIPAIFVSGGPMEAGKIQHGNTVKTVDLIDAMVLAADPKATDAEVDEYEHAACPTCGSCSGMFTANSMNCLNEALGLALPGNGTIVATHVDRKELFLQAGRTIVDLARRYYEHDDLTALPRGIATFQAFENAMTLDISMGGSTNTVLHLLAAAQEAQVPFTMADIDRLSRRVPNLCKVAPSAPNVHLEDVHRAGGIMAILGELDRAGLLHRDVPTVYAPTLGAAIDALDVKRGVAPAVEKFFRAAPFGVRTTVAFSQSARYPDLDLDRDTGVIRNVAHAFSKDGGLAVLYGNIAEEGCIVKTAGVDAAHLTFTGPARIFESQDSAVEAILGDRIVPGDVVLIRYEGPRGGPGMQEMLYPTSYLKSKGLGKSCALITDGRFSGGSSGLCIGHISPEAAEAGAIALVEEGDTIQIDIPKRILRVNLSDAELAKRRAAMEARGAADSNAVDAESKCAAAESKGASVESKGESAKSKGPAAWKPVNRARKVSQALQAYAALTTSASRGAVRDVSRIQK